MAIYEPQLSPAPTVEDFEAAVLNELQRIADTFRDQQLAQFTLEILTAEPDRVVDGLIVRADGTNWDPGSGAGVYWYEEATTAWKLLG